MERIKTALLVGLLVTIGFTIPDVITGTFDRANIAVPFIAVVSAWLAQIKP